VKKEQVNRRNERNKEEIELKNNDRKQERNKRKGMKNRMK
jgi:hypothetical protein